MIGRLVAREVLKTPHYIEAFRAINRARFVPAKLRERAYADYPLPIGFGQTISQPETVAFMIELLQPGPGQKILDVGSGSGYQTALLAWIVSHTPEGLELPAGQAGKVVGVELIPELARLGAKQVERYKFFKNKIVEMHCLNGAKGYPTQAPFDRVIAAAAGEEIPPAWQEQIKVGGRIVAPLGDDIVLQIKTGLTEYETKSYEGFVFVPFVTEEG